MKKIISTILSLAICFTVFYAPISVKAAEIENNDEYVQILDDFGYNNVKVKDAAQLSRVEFIKTLSMFLGYTSDYAIDSDPFDDLHYYDDGAREAAYLKGLGVIKGAGDNRFNGNEPITMTEAYIFAERALGYLYVSADRIGLGNPITLAANIGLDDGIKSNDSVLVTSATAKRLIYNMMTADCLQIVSIQDSEVQYQSSGKTLFEIYYKVVPVEGIVTRNTITDINSLTGTLDDFKTEIDGYLYDDPDRRSLDFIGENVKAFVNTDNELLYIYEYNNKIISLTEEDKPEYDDFKISYMTENGKKRSYNLSKSYSYIYNGVTKAFDKNDFNYACGTVTLIDNDRDNVYDVLKVDKYNYLISNASSVKDNAIFDYERKSVINSSGEAYVMLQAFDGNDYTPCVITDIDNGMLIQYTESEDKLFYNIIVSKNTVSGTLQELSDEYMTVNEIKYKPADGFVEKNKNVLAVGTQYKFYLNNRNLIVDFETNLSYGAYDWGYLINISQKSSSMNDEFKCKILQSDGTINIFDLADKVILDGERLKKDIAKDALLKDIGVKRQLLRFKLNSTNQIAGIDTAVSDTSLWFSGELNDDNRNVKFYNRENVSYNPSCGFETHKYILDSTTKVFLVPSDIGLSTEKAGYDDEDFKVIGTSWFQQIAYKYDVYNISKNGIPEAIVVYSDIDRTLREDSQYAVISDVLSALDNDGETRKQYTYWNDGNFKTAFLSDNLSNEYEPGDLVKFELGSDGKIAAAKLIYDQSAETKASDTSVRFRTFLGNPLVLNENTLRMNIDGSFMFFDLSQANYVVYNNSRQIVKTGNKEDLMNIVGLDDTDKVRVAIIYFNYKVTGCIIYD